jgi:aminopeptidase YwaD
MKKLLLILAFVPVLLFSQTRKQRKALAAQHKADQQIINNFKSHILNLSTISPAHVSGGSTLAMEYISNEFQSVGLKPKGTKGYIIPFKINNGKQIKATTFLKVNGTLLAVKKEYFPLSYSAQKATAGMPAMALREKGVPWFADIKEWIEDNLNNQTFDINSIVYKEAERAAVKGATALFLYNTGNNTDNIKFNNKDKTRPLPLPVIYITPQGYNKYFNDQSQMLDIELNVAFEETITNAYNVAGYIDNGAASNIIIAAPYDHFSEEENENTKEDKRTTDSLNTVSGTSILIELARMLTASKAKNNNYTFVAYYDNNLLPQSSEWLRNSAIDSPPNYIINLNRVGRYNDDRKLLIEGYGTPDAWIQSFRPLADKTLEISCDSSFKGRDTLLRYVRVPVLSFSVGAFKENDVASTAGDKINYEGELHFTRFVYQIIEATDAKGKIAFAEKLEKTEQKVSQPAASSQKKVRP